MTTTTTPASIRKALNLGYINNLADMVKLLQLGTAMTPIQVTIASLAAHAHHDITSAAVLAAVTDLVGITLDTNEMLPPIGEIVALRVTGGGSATNGPRNVGDAGDTPAWSVDGAQGVATLSADGKTLTFEDTVDGFVLWYWPKIAVPTTTTSASAF
jgi:hypothetical protein